MNWACIYLSCNKSVQIREISVRIYDESCMLLDEHHSVFCKGGQLMSDEEYNKAKIRLSNQINAWLQDVERIVVWDNSSYTLLNEAIKNNNAKTRYIIVMSRSMYVSRESAKLQLMAQRRDVPKCVYMCENVANIAIKIFQNNDFFIRGSSECYSIEQTEKKKKKN